MIAKRLFKRNMDGANAVHDLYNKHTGHSVIQFNGMKITKAPDSSLWLCINQWRDGLEKPLDKLLFYDFKKKYVDHDDVMHFDPMSRVYLKLEWDESADFEFELFYELCSREHEPVYL